MLSQLVPVLTVQVKAAFPLMVYSRFPSYLSCPLDTLAIVSRVCRPSQTPCLDVFLEEGDGAKPLGSHKRPEGGPSMTKGDDQDDLWGCFRIAGAPPYATPDHSISRSKLESNSKGSSFPSLPQTPVPVSVVSPGCSPGQ